MEAIGIDIGTTSICAVVLDVRSGEVVRSVSQDSDAFIKTDKEYEKIQDAERIIEKAKAMLDSLITDKTAVIGVTGQMHGIVYTDKEGKCVSPLYTWQDGRGNLLYKNGVSYAGYLKSFSGYGNVTDFYNKENGLRPQSAEGFCTIHDYFVMSLCALKKAKVHISDGASFGLFDLEKKKFKIDCGIEVFDNFTIAGEYKGIPVSVAIGDNQASVLSTTREDDILINVGTGSQISAIADKIVESEGIETRPYFEGKNLVVGCALCGGRAYAILKDFYKKIYSYKGDISDIEVYSLMGEMVKNADTPLKVDTRFSGTRGNEGVRGSIEGITTENLTPEALTAGVLEGMINELLSMYDSMGVQKSGLVGSGNGIRKNEFLKSVAEDKTGKKMRIPKNMEEASLGAAIYASIAAGIYENMAEASQIAVKYI